MDDALDFVGLETQYARYRHEIEERMRAVFAHGLFIMGPEVLELERQLADHADVRHALAVASGTDSLEIALRALGIGPGDEVINAPFAWISPAEVTARVGARPVFVDIEPDTFNLNPALLGSAITPRTKAIIPVSLFGQMADLERINAIAAGQGIAVIEDGAQSFGATQRGRKSCGVTLLGSTSFFPTKTLGCYGDGGAIFTDDDDLNDRMRALRTHGASRRYQHHHLGMNSRLDTLQAAVLLAKLPFFHREIEERERIGALMTERLQEWCVVPSIAPGNNHVYTLYTIRVRDRDAVANRLKSAGIQTAVYYPKCLHEQEVFRSLGYACGDFPEAEKAASEVLSLPMHPFLTESEQLSIGDALRDAVLVSR